MVVSTVRASTWGVPLDGSAAERCGFRLAPAWCGPDAAVLTVPGNFGQSTLAGTARAVTDRPQPGRAGRHGRGVPLPYRALLSHAAYAARPALLGECRPGAVSRGNVIALGS